MLICEAFAKLEIHHKVGFSICINQWRLIAFVTVVS